MSKNIQEHVGEKVCNYLKNRDDELLFYKNAICQIQEHFKEKYNDDDSARLFFCHIENCPYFAMDDYDYHWANTIDSKKVHMFQCCNCGLIVCAHHFNSSKFYLLNDEYHKSLGLQTCNTNDGLSLCDFYDWSDNLKERNLIKYKGDAYPMCSPCKVKISNTIHDLSNN